MFEAKNLSELLKHIENSVANETYLNYLHEQQFKSISSAEFVRSVRALASAFQKSGIGQGSTVAIIADSSPFWLITDYALQCLGAVSVPIFADISPENLQFELEDAAIRYAFVSTKLHYEKLMPFLQKMELVLVKDIHAKGANVQQWETFIGEDLRYSRPEIHADDLATIIYTSGSTGRPKGVELSHNNIITQLEDTQMRFDLEPSFRALSFLPLAHIFERMVMSYYLMRGISVYFVDDVKNVAVLLKEVKPHVMTVVPRLLDKVYTKMHEGAAGAKGLKWLVAKAAFYHADHKDPSTQADSFIDRLFAHLVYTKLLDVFGGELRYLISGGAPLSLAVYRFFHNIGLPLYQGYGLTESSPVISVNTARYNRVGTCGKAYPHVEVKLAEDGELLVRGQSVMRGYHKAPEMTKEVIDEQGWLHTGDLASIDAEGYITVLSRKKELFKTSTGKYISAVAIEQKITANKWIDYAVVIADGRPFVSALVFMDEAECAALTQEHLQRLVQALVDRVNTRLNRWEQIQKFYISKQSVSIQNGLLTPSMKIAREKVEEHYKEQIENFYRSES
ncbi:MAG: long-chain fatty acid--CoA ligase [Campylobacterales bacterium]|nr:long-chain fatty acid--CoA ligase [Campylobacterales bacterium]